MASTGDIRDIMDLSHDALRQPALKKKKKNIEPQPRLSGMSREVQALMGDSVPPVAIVETPKYKQKPSVAMKMFKPRHWEDRSFVHGARKDGLQLRHWKRSIPGSKVRKSAPVSAELMDVDTTADDDDETPAATDLDFEVEFPSEKWDVKPPIASYTDEQYEKHFASEEWTREETDRLMELCQEFDLRWLLVSDRYDPADISPKNIDVLTDDAVKQIYPQRRMEDLKQRYYAIAAKMLETQTPASNMTQSEFQLWEKMRNFDARSEAQRKAMAEKLFERTKEEAEEEKVLLEELYRITKNEEDFIKIRKELYSRLETAPSLRRNERGEEPSTAIYQTSQGLSMLLSSLLAKEKRLKTRIAPNGQEVPATQTPVENQRSRPSNQHSRRETMDSNAGDDHGGPSKKGSMSQTPIVRTLTPAEEVKFGVSHPQERITSGVMFRHEKINRLTMAKSQVQTQKIGAALTELGIPPRLLMPTERVCREFERLVSEVQILLDTRRVLEKVSSEVKVLKEHKKLRLGGDEEEGDQTPDSMQVDGNAETVDRKSGADTGSGAQSSVAMAGGNQGQTGEKAATGSTAANDIKPSQLQDSENADADETQVRDEEEEDDGDDNEVDQSAVVDDDEEGDEVNQSYAQQDEDDEEEEGDQDEDEDNEVNLGEDEDEEDEDDDDDAPGLEDLERANQVTDDEDEENEEDDDGNPVRLVEEDDEDEDGDRDDEDEDQPEVGESLMNGADEDDEEAEEEEEADEDEDDGAPEEPTRPISSHSNTRAHKRSASVLSESSRAGSNRSGAGRKKRK